VIRRTTIELDEDLVNAARSMLGQSTLRGTVEVALRRAVQEGKADQRAERKKQIDAIKRLSSLIDKDVLLSGEAWR
jgi:Arc/MetJ family transcription regulator